MSKPTYNQKDYLLQELRTYRLEKKPFELKQIIEKLTLEEYKHALALIYNNNLNELKLLLKINYSMQCSKCQGDMKLIPAGFSKKTGKPYDAFYSCTNRDCGNTMKANTPKYKFEQSLDQNTQDAKWNEISRGKCRHAYAVEAFKSGLDLTDELKEKINQWTDFSMNG